MELPVWGGASIRRENNSIYAHASRVGDGLKSEQQKQGNNGMGKREDWKILGGAKKGRRNISFILLIEA
jgi:hypothetical protein